MTLLCCFYCISFRIFLGAIIVMFPFWSSQEDPVQHQVHQRSLGVERLRGAQDPERLQAHLPSQKLLNHYNCRQMPPTCIAIGTFCLVCAELFSAPCKDALVWRLLDKQEMNNHIGPFAKLACLRVVCKQTPVYSCSNSQPVFRVGRYGLFISCWQTKSTGLGVASTQVELG